MNLIGYEWGYSWRYYWGYHDIGKSMTNDGKMIHYNNNVPG
jgi:hypothetical protein